MLPGCPSGGTSTNRGQRLARCRRARYAVSRNRWKLARMKKPLTCWWNWVEKVGRESWFSEGYVTVARPRSSIYSQAEAEASAPGLEMPLCPSVSLPGMQPLPCSLISWDAVPTMPTHPCECSPMLHHARLSFGVQHLLYPPVPTKPPLCPLTCCWMLEDRLAMSSCRVSTSPACTGSRAWMVARDPW